MADDCCMGHTHVTVHCVHFSNRAFGEVIISDSNDGALVVANALLAEPSVLAVFETETTVWLN